MASAAHLADGARRAGGAAVPSAATRGRAAVVAIRCVIHALALAERQARAARDLASAGAADLTRQTHEAPAVTGATPAIRWVGLGVDTLIAAARSAAQAIDLASADRAHLIDPTGDAARSTVLRVAEGLDTSAATCALAGCAKLHVGSGIGGRAVGLVEASIACGGVSRTVPNGVLDRIGRDVGSSCIGAIRLDGLVGDLRVDGLRVGRLRVDDIGGVSSVRRCTNVGVITSATANLHREKSDPTRCREPTPKRFTHLRPSDDGPPRGRVSRIGQPGGIGQSIFLRRAKFDKQLCAQVRASTPELRSATRPSLGRSSQGRPSQSMMALACES